MLCLIICIETCKSCGHVGPEESFCRRFKDYCSLKCAQSFRFKQESQSSIASTVASAPSLKVLCL